MAEVGSALPYISAMRVTKRLTNRVQPTGYETPDGRQQLQEVSDKPGIEVEVTTYMGSVKGPALYFHFPLKSFFEDALNELLAKENKSQADSDAIANLQATIARTDIIWCEQVLLAGQLPPLNTLWADVFSDALDEFPKWAEDGRGAGGIDIHIKEMQWTIRVPYESAKSVELGVGLFLSDQQKYTNIVHQLAFEDATTATQRANYNQQLSNRIDELNQQLGELPEGPSPQRTQLTQDIAAYTQELSQRSEVDVTTISALLQHESVQESLPALLLAIISTLKAKHWPNLDMQLVAQRMQLIIGSIS